MDKGNIYDPHFSTKLPHISIAESEATANVKSICWSDEDCSRQKQTNSMKKPIFLSSGCDEACHVPFRVPRQTGGAGGYHINREALPRNE
jgi:hypothetical protein